LQLSDQVNSERSISNAVKEQLQGSTARAEAAERILKAQAAMPEQLKQLKAQVQQLQQQLGKDQVQQSSTANFLQQ
jgi:histidinol-phosphate/aromatic aminotransferase/cobyric acid decarboxylase-like protein